MPESLSFPTEPGMPALGLALNFVDFVGKTISAVDIFPLTEFGGRWTVRFTFFDGSEGYITLADEQAAQRIHDQLRAGRIELYYKVDDPYP